MFFPQTRSRLITISNVIHLSSGQKFESLRPQMSRNAPHTFWHSSRYCIQPEPFLPAQTILAININRHGAIHMKIFYSFCKVFFFVFRFAIFSLFFRFWQPDPSSRPALAMGYGLPGGNSIYFHQYSMSMQHLRGQNQKAYIRHVESQQQLQQQQGERVPWG